MDLVLFEDAMRHIARIVRVIMNSGGHALLGYMPACLDPCTVPPWPCPACSSHLIGPDYCPVLSCHIISYLALSSTLPYCHILPIVP